jgi:hypothetical protein
MLQNATFLLLDAARMGGVINEARERNAANDSLYRGSSSERLSSVAPYLFQFAYRTSFANWYFKSGWGQSWGILFRSSYPLAAVHRHFRKFIMVQSEGSQQLYFRFYDPRVLRIFLPTCSRDQILEFFGDVVDYFIVEDKDPAFAIRYRHENGELRTERMPVAEIIAELPAPDALPGKAGEDDELPPETIEALRAEGKLEEVLAAMNAGKPAGDMAPAGNPGQQETPSQQQQSPAAHAQAPKAVAAVETPSPKKSKWNMFD